MKRVLSLSTLYPNIAAPRFGTFVARQLEALAARGDWDVTLINPIGLPPLPFGRYRTLAAARADGEEQGVQIYRPRFTLLPKWGGPINPAMIARAVIPLARNLHTKKPFDLVDAQFFYPDGPAAERIAHALGLPLSIKARGADISYWGTQSSPRKQMLAAAKKAAGLLAVSEQLAEDMAAMGLPREKVTVHYTGLDHKLFHPLDPQESRQRLIERFQLAIPENVSLLVTVGAFIPRKGQRLVIEALLARKDTHLLLAGQGPDETMLRQMAGELGLAERVHFLGSLDDIMLPVLFSAADAMVLPSESEGLANVWVEALACGTPLVITQVGGAGELLRSPIAGRMVERNTPAIVEGIEAVLTSTAPAADIAATVAHFSWENNAAELAAYFTEIADR
ncbi:glycosyltransferase family 4 protein [Altericroceibacterium spongiae]|uniref:Glycosyltransferase family 4 protein n=1 Tax=Altericroceibacterium spongiae TaxID=2320269 RepID=A0A420EKG7_9SPHN|nr:glycosyltransferase [Altericroceibacterium spongiae]RKF21177.1 glycosyltransferase family 4 protein [Altericroceibacterium spongiae]